MRILAVDSSAVSASAAIYDDEKLIAENFVNNKLTHSQTLMMMVEQVLSTADIPLSSIDVFAACTGPGSFTGIRIGVSAIKGISFAQGKPCVSVSTLEAIAQNMNFTNDIICSVMDARCKQVYNGIFKAENGTLKRLTEDRAIAIEQLGEELKKYSETVWLVGDGAELCYNELCENENIKLSPVHLRFQRGYGVALSAFNKAKNGEMVTANELNPIYLRLPQAERELKKRQGEKLC